MISLSQTPNFQIAKLSGTKPAPAPASSLPAEEVELTALKDPWSFSSQLGRKILKN